MTSGFDMGISVHVELAPPRVGRRGPVGVSDDAVHWAGGDTLPAAGAQLGQDLDGERPTQHRTEHGRASLHAGVAVDAVRALHAVGREPPTGVSAAGTNAPGPPRS